MARLKEIVRREIVTRLLHSLWSEEAGQDVAEYAMMLAVVLVIVVGTVRLIGSNAGNVFSSVGSAIQ
jgi:Flp pilus assembly pilin Flp